NETSARYQYPDILHNTDYEDNGSRKNTFPEASLQLPYLVEINGYTSENQSTHLLPGQPLVIWRPSGNQASAAITASVVLTVATFCMAKFIDALCHSAFIVEHASSG